MRPDNDRHSERQFDLKSFFCYGEADIVRQIQSRKHRACWHQEFLQSNSAGWWRGDRHRGREDHRLSEEERPVADGDVSLARNTSFSHRSKVSRFQVNQSGRSFFCSNSSRDTKPGRVMERTRSASDPERISSNRADGNPPDSFGRSANSRDVPAASAALSTGLVSPPAAKRTRALNVRDAETTASSRNGNAISRPCESPTWRGRQAVSHASLKRSIICTCSVSVSASA
jgi:hypothetical protein